MSDSLRQDTTDKVGSSLKPDSHKSTTEQVSDQAKGAADSVGKTLQPEGEKSTSQKASDMLSGDTASSDDNAKKSEGVMESVKGTLGMGEKK